MSYSLCSIAWLAMKKSIGSRGGNFKKKLILKIVLCRNISCFGIILEQIYVKKYIKLLRVALSKAGEVIFLVDKIRANSSLGVCNNRNKKNSGAF